MTRIIQITDPHLGPDPDFKLAGVPTRTSFELVLQSALNLEPDLLLVTGDIAAHPDAKSYQQFFEIIDASSVPMVWLPGNHDEIAQVEAIDGGVPYTKSHDVDNWRILLLDSVIPHAPGGRLGDDELQRFEELLEKNTQDHILVCVHHHPVNIGSAWLDQQRIEDSDKFLALVDASDRVRGVHWGHIHQVYEETRNGVLFASAPSTCIQFKPGSESFALDDTAPGFRVIDLHPNGSIQTDIHRVPEAKFQVDLDSVGY